MSPVFRILIAFSIGLLSCHRKENSPSTLTVTVISDFLKEAENKAYPLQKRIIAALKADSIAREQNNEQNHLICLRTIGTLYLKKGDNAIAKSYFFQAVDLAQSISSNEDLAISLNSLGIILNRQAEYDSAIQYYNRANQIFRILHQQTWVAQSLVDIGVTFKNKGDFQAALTANFEAIRLFDSLKNSKDLAYAYISTGTNLKEVNRLKEAIDYQEKALQILKKINDSDGIAMALNNIGNVYSLEKNYKKALINFSQSLEIKQRKGTSQKALATTINNMGKVYFELNDLNNAETHLANALSIRIALQDTDGIVTTSNYLSKLYLKKGDLIKAEKIALSTFNMNSQTVILKQHLENNLVLKEIYEGLKQDKLALQYANNALSLKDSLFNSDMAVAISEMQTKYKTEQKEKELLTVKQQATIEAERNRSRLQFWGVLGLAILFISFLGFYFNRKREQYLFKQEILEVKQEALIAQLDTHFISDTIDSINGFVEDNDKESASEYLLKFSRLIRTVLGNSLKKIVPLQDDLANLDDYFKLVKLRFPEDHLTMKVAIDEKIDAESTLIPPMILQVLTENAIQHAFTVEKKGILFIEIRKSGNFVHCAVEDNGIGRQASEINKKSERNSYGSRLAEKLMKVWEEAEGKTTYEIIDLMDTGGNPIGTRAEFSFPFISNK